MQSNRTMSVVAVTLALLAQCLLGGVPAVAAPTGKPAPPGAPAATSSGAHRSAASDAVEPHGVLASVETDENLRCAVQRDGYANEFFGTWSCGTDIAVDGVLFGHLGGAYDVVSQNTTGSGSASDPWVIRTEVALGATGVTAVQTDRVAAGSSGFLTTVTVHNASSDAHDLIVYRSGDCYVADGDFGYGELTAGGGVACVSSDRTKTLTWTPVTDGSTRLEDHFGTNYSTDQALEPLPGTCTCDSLLDNGMSLRWERQVPAGTAAAFSSRLDLAGADTDGDGLPDAWESSGARDDSGNVTYDLAAMGASPLHRDLFLYVESEKDAPLSAGARKKLVAAYAAAPEKNPDGTTGINLHVVDGPTLPYATSDQLRSGFGDLSTEPDWDVPWVHWRQQAPAGPSVFHLVLSIAWKGGKWPEVAGIGQLPGQMVVINNCGKRKTSRSTCDASTTDQATNLMHEVGHNLGLQHGGGDGINRKPNYPSVMNYLFSHTGVPGAGLTYSRWGDETFYPLDESSLAEGDGLLTKVPVVKGLTTLRYCPGGKKPKSVKLNAKVDWDCDGKTDKKRVKASVNGNKIREVLQPYDDWANIALAPAGTSLGRPIVADGAARSRSMR